jgi:hypothetical protein
MNPHRIATVVTLIESLGRDSSSRTRWRRISRRNSLGVVERHWRKPACRVLTLTPSSEVTVPMLRVCCVSYGQVIDEVTAFGVTYASAFLSWYCSASAMAIETSVCRPAFIRTTLHTIGSAFLLAAFMMSSNNCETSGTLSTEYLTGWG